jgi:hypothetical protein
MAPRRPLLFHGQYALALVTAVVMGASLALVVWVMLGGEW